MVLHPFSVDPKWNSGGDLPPHSHLQYSGKLWLLSCPEHFSLLTEGSSLNGGIIYVAMCWVPLGWFFLTSDGLKKILIFVIYPAFVSWFDRECHPLLVSTYERDGLFMRCFKIHGKHLTKMLSFKAQHNKFLWVVIPEYVFLSTHSGSWKSIEKKINGKVTRCSEIQQYTYRKNAKNMKTWDPEDSTMKDSLY